MACYGKDGHRGGVPPTIWEAVEGAAAAGDLVVAAGDTGWLTVLDRLEITCIFFFSAANRARMLATTALWLVLPSMEVAFLCRTYS